MREAVLMLYGEYQNDEGIVHPWQEDMFRDPHELQAQFKERGVDFHVGVALELPQGRRELGNPPRIIVATNPRYNERGVLDRGTKFVETSLDEYPGVIDHWVANFQDRVPQPGGTLLRTAYGLGIPNERVWNCRPIQDMGNRKDYMDAVLQEHGVAVPTYGLSESELEKFSAEVGDQELIYKPIDGSRGKGIEVFSALGALKKALQEGRLSRSGGFVQPFLDLRSPIEGLKPANAAAAEALADVNSRRDRVRETRMHVLAYTDQNGEIQAEAYPTLKYSHPKTKTMKVGGNVALDAACMTTGNYMHDTSVTMAKFVVAAAAQRSGEPVSQYYGVFDWIVDAQGRAYVGDGNCRGPALAPEAIAAREAFTRIISDSARNLL